MKSLRHLAREAVIFTLLGPIPVFVGWLAVETYGAPPRAAYTTVKACSSFEPLPPGYIPDEPLSTAPCQLIH